MNEGMWEEKRRPRREKNETDHFKSTYERRKQALCVCLSSLGARVRAIGAERSLNGKCGDDNDNVRT